MDWKEAENKYNSEKSLLKQYYDMRFEELETPEELIELNEFTEKREKEIEREYINNLKGGRQNACSQ